MLRSICDRMSITVDNEMNDYNSKMKTWSRRRRPAAERFWEKVDKNGPVPVVPELGRCWTWTASKDSQGYGQFGTGEGKKVIKAYRWAWENDGGEHVPRMHLDHLCRNPTCVRPSHLELVTHRENLMRGSTIPAINAAKTHCPRGHEYSPDNVYLDPRRNHRHCRLCLKLNQRIDPDNPRVVYISESTKSEIRARYAAGGVTYKALGEQFGIHMMTVGKIIRNDPGRPKAGSV